MQSNKIGFNMTKYEDTDVRTRNKSYANTTELLRK